MNTNNNRQRLVRCLLILVGSVFVFQACEPVRTVQSTRSTGYKFLGHNDHELDSKKKDNDAMSKFSAKNKGEKRVVNSKGEVVRTEKRGDLYSDREGLKVRESGTAFRGQDAKFKAHNYKSKSFKTPEYLKRDTYATSSYREGSQQSREGEKSFAHQLFKTETARQSNKASRAAAKSYRKVDDFSTSSNRTATDAQKNAAIPTGTANQTGYKKSPLTLDDVRKLVHPESVR